MKNIKIILPVFVLLLIIAIAVVCCVKYNSTDDDAPIDASSDEGTEYDPTERNYRTDALLDEAKEYKPTDDSFDKIEHGMTLQEVIDIVGRPHVTYSGGIGEHYAWETQSGKYYIVLFHDVEPVTGKLTDEIRKTNLFVWGIYPPKEAMSTNS